MNIREYGIYSEIACRLFTNEEVSVFGQIAEKVMDNGEILKSVHQKPLYESEYKAFERVLKERVVSEAKERGLDEFQASLALEWAQSHCFL